MGVDLRSYSVLVVSSSQTFNNAILELLPPSKYQPIDITANISEAKRHIAERSFDFELSIHPYPMITVPVLRLIAVTL